MTTIVASVSLGGIAADTLVTGDNSYYPARKVTYGIPLSKVYRHKDLNDTDCPAAMFPWSKFQSMLIGV